MDFQCRQICICVGRKVARKYAGTEQLYTVHHGYCSFRYQVVSIQVDSVEVQIVSRKWLKERGLFTPNGFLAHYICYTTIIYSTIRKVSEIVVQFHCLSCHRNNFGTKRPVSVYYLSSSIQCKLVSLRANSSERSEP